jgi:hypothetical protein
MEGEILFMWMHAGWSFVLFAWLAMLLKRFSTEKQVAEYLVSDFLRKL